MGRATLLCVEDEPLILKSLEAILSAHGYEVLTASTGEEAIEKFSAQSVDAVILDNHLPQMSGSDVLAAIKTARPAVPVILCSGEYPDGSAFTPDAVLLKPVPPPELLARIAALLRQANSACA